MTKEMYHMYVYYTCIKVAATQRFQNMSEIFGYHMHRYLSASPFPCALSCS